MRNQGEGLEEREIMRGLLLALQKTRGFAELAGELAHRNGTCKCISLSDYYAVHVNECSAVLWNSIWDDISRTNVG